MATANVITGKPYGLFISSLSKGVISTGLVEVSTIILFPGSGATTTNSITLTDKNGDPFWMMQGGFSVTAGSLADFFTSGMRVDGIICSVAPADTASSMAIKLK